MARARKQGTPKAYPSHERGRNAYGSDRGGLDGISGSGEKFDGQGNEPAFYGGGVGNRPDGSGQSGNWGATGNSTNDRKLDMEPGKFRTDFNGRTDYKSRPKKNTERVPELGDKGIPPQIPSGIGSPKMRGPIVDPALGESRGIPPMTANPSGIGISVKGVTIKDPHE